MCGPEKFMFFNGGDIKTYLLAGGNNPIKRRKMQYYF